MRKIFLFLVILGLFVFFYLQQASPRRDADEVALKEETNTTQEKKIGEMVFRHEKSVNVVREYPDFLNLDIKANIKKFNREEGYKEIISSSAPLIFSLSKNINLENKPIREWFQKNNPEEEKQSVYSVVSEEEIKVGGLSALKVRYLSNLQLTGGFYDLITIYLSHNTDIYEISYYAIPINQVDSDFALNQEDIKNAEEYNRTVDKIIESIKFSKI